MPEEGSDCKTEGPAPRATFAEFAGNLPVIGPILKSLIGASPATWRLIFAAVVILFYPIATVAFLLSAIQFLPDSLKAATQSAILWTLGQPAYQRADINEANRTIDGVMLFQFPVNDANVETIARQIYIAQVAFGQELEFDAQLQQLPITASSSNPDCLNPLKEDDQIGTLKVHVMNTEIDADAAVRSNASEIRPISSVDAKSWKVDDKYKARLGQPADLSIHFEPNDVFKRFAKCFTYDVNIVLSYKKLNI